MTQCERDELTLLINGVYQLVPYSAVKCLQWSAAHKSASPSESDAVEVQ